jgi:hypothetical protein
MAKEFRVVDCRATLADPAELIVMADTAEHAARLAIGEDLVRGTSGGPGRNVLRARVYSQGTNGLSMVRLYARAAAGGVPDRRNPPNRWGE